MTKACAAAERTGDIENADLAEDCAVGQRREHGHAVVRDDRQLTALDDVQLLPDVALTADLRLPSQPTTAATGPHGPVLISSVVVSGSWSCSNGRAYTAAHYPSR